MRINNTINNNRNSRVRFNIVSVCIYLFGIVLLIQLFNLQIVNGQKFREQSNTRLVRESKVEAARGQILDRTGTSLATVKSGYNLELYKTKVEDDVLNQSLLDIVNTLEKNGDKYSDNFPISINPIQFKVGEKEQEDFKEYVKIPKDYNAVQCFEFMKEKYNIKQTSLEEIRKILVLRYQIYLSGYSSTKSVTLAKNISYTSVLQFNEQNQKFPGVNTPQQPTRTYAYNNLASHILGTVGRIDQEEYEANKDIYTMNDTIGKNGVEYVFEKYLKGTDGKKHIEMSVDGTITNEYISKEAISGSNVVLTIDGKLQEIAENAIEANVIKIASNGMSSKRGTADSGSVVVTNVKTGEVLAMASYPDYNPNDFVNGITEDKWNQYNSNSANPLFNRAIQGHYAPGSTFKMVTAIAALESGAVGINEKVNDTGVYPRAYHPVCWLWTSSKRGHGYLSMSDAIKHSCNYYFYEMGYRIGIDTLEKYARYLGLGSKTGIELPGETSGTVASKSAAEAAGQGFYLGDTLSAAIGQSYNSFSPIQMCKYISMVANGGNQIDMTIIKSIINSDGTEVSKAEINDYVNEKLGLEKANTENMSFKKENVNAVLEGMRSVTTEVGGTAYSIFKNFNIEVGGKTGTAQVDGGKTIGWFTGFAPFDDPEIAVVVVVENAGSGSYTAEVARDIIAQYFGMNANQVKEDMTVLPEAELQR